MAAAAPTLKEVTTPAGTKIRVTPPSGGSDYSARVVYADPGASTGEAFAAGASADGVPLDKVGSWTQAPAGVKTAGTTSSSSSSSSSSSEASGVAATAPGSSDVCAGQVAATQCEIYSTGWVRLAHDAGTHNSFSCPADHPYLLGTWQGGDPLGASSSGASGGTASSVALGSSNERFTGSWTWARDHWTITVWETPFVSEPSQGIKYSAQNWNTIWGDAWHFQVMLPCGTSPTPKPSSN